MDEFVISCSQDQNIKVWELAKCKERAPPKAKKNKKKKGPIQHSKANITEKNVTIVEENKSDSD